MTDKRVWRNCPVLSIGAYPTAFRFVPDGRSPNIVAYKVDYDKFALTLRVDRPVHAMDKHRRPPRLGAAAMDAWRWSRRFDDQDVSAGRKA